MIAETLQRKQQLIDKIKREKIVAIVRGVSSDKLSKLLEALHNGGIRFVEITFDSSGKITDEQTAENINMLSRKFTGRLHIGAGTVVKKKQAQLAVTAGAEYLISPNVAEEVITYALEHGIVSIPGAMTPSEAVRAYDIGADFVKIFPSDSLGVGYIKALCAPLSNIPFMAVGGVNDKNIGNFLNAGVCCVGVGSNITPKDLIAAEDWDGISKLAKTYCYAVKKMKEINHADN